MFTLREILHLCFLLARIWLAVLQLLALQHDSGSCSGSCEPDLRCRLSKARIYLRKTPGGRDFGMGREWGGDGNGEIRLRATWDQGGWDPITARRVPSK